MANELKNEFATIGNDPYVPQYQVIMTPTDEVLASRGGVAGLKVYDEIRRDPHAFAILQKRKLEVVSREWRVEPPENPSRLEKRAAAEVEKQLKAIDFDKLTKGLLGAILKGFSVAELIWDNVDGVWTVKLAKVKKQRRFRMTTEGQLRLLTRASTLEGEAVPNRKFIVHRHSIDDDDDDPYGVGIGSVLFWPAWFKRQVLAHWLRGVEKHATPTTLATYDGGFDEVRQNKLLAAMRAMANDTGIAVPESVKMELLEAKNGGGGDLQEKLSRYLDELMSEAVLGETLSTNSGERGARSLGEIHNEVRIAIAKADSDLLCATLKETIVRWIIELNFPGARLPELYRDFSETEDLDDKAERDKKLHDMGYEPTDVSYINETYGGEWIKKQAQQPAPGEETAPKPATANLEFSDPAENASKRGQTAVEVLSNQLETVAQPHIDAMVEAIRTEFSEATGYDDLILRLARLSSEMGVDDIATALEQGSLLAQLEGVDSVNG
jgi:phage gp29-like protein